jgi:hypothetical protein
VVLAIEAGDFWAVLAITAADFCPAGAALAKTVALFCAPVTGLTWVPGAADVALLLLASKAGLVLAGLLVVVGVVLADFIVLAATAWVAWPGLTTTITFFELSSWALTVKWQRITKINVNVILFVISLFIQVGLLKFHLSD